ncbi:MAG TPA: HEAT repeat domain-containing protein [Thermodesulfovibrionales bacterium]|nr:HEAT repeat domain-containing protein [Thermodesulfovibrionales bacterium]
MSRHTDVRFSKVLSAVGCLLVISLIMLLSTEVRAEQSDKVKNLIQKLKSKHAHTRATAIKELGKIKDERVVALLINGLADADSYVRGLAARELGDMGEARSVPQLITVLGKDDYVYPRVEAARALGKIKDARAIIPLVQALRDASNEVRDESTRALIGIGKPATDQLLTVLKERNVKVVADAYYFYVCLGEPDSEPILIDALNKLGTENMALDFMRCGNIHLREAALRWAESRHYKIEERSEAVGNPRWGKCRGAIPSGK